MSGTSAAAEAGPCLAVAGKSSCPLRGPVFRANRCPFCWKTLRAEVPPSRLGVGWLPLSLGASRLSQQPAEPVVPQGVPEAAARSPAGRGHNLGMRTRRRAKGRCLEGDALGGALRLFQIFTDVAKPFSRLFSRASTAQAGSGPACRRASREGERPATPGRSRLVHSSGTGGGGRITSCCLSAGRPATGPSASKLSSLWRGSRNRGRWVPVRADQDRGAAGGAPVPLSGVAP